MKSVVTRLKDMELGAVTVAANDVCLHLIKYPMLENNQATDEGSIDIEVGYTIECDGQAYVYRQNGNPAHLHQGVAQLLKLIGHTIVSSVFAEDNKLILAFDNQTSLVCLKDPTGFESFHINLIGDTGGMTV